ncbi:unnamed protein product [Calypogeia fissa]
MSTAASRSRSLALYRKLLRSSRTWPGPASEKKYILEETSTLFRVNQHLTDPKEINDKIVEGESRYDIAWHYKIPYPRLHNFATGTVTEKPSRPAGPSYKIPSDEMGSLDDGKPSAHSGGWATLSMRS